MNKIFIVAQSEFMTLVRSKAFIISVILMPVVMGGSIFLVRRTPTDWTHTGLVTDAVPVAFDTIEGNTNDDGDREGFEVCSRSRGYASKDFITLS